MSQFTDCDGAGWVDAALINPFLYAGKVDRGKLSEETSRVLDEIVLLFSSQSPPLVDGSAIGYAMDIKYRWVEEREKNILVGVSAFAVHDNILGLTTIETRRNFSVLTLTLVTTTGSFTFAGRRTTSSSNAFVVG